VIVAGHTRAGALSAPLLARHPLDHDQAVHVSGGPFSSEL
jgi:hypothetical protein